MHAFGPESGAWPPPKLCADRTRSPVQVDVTGQMRRSISLAVRVAGRTDNSDFA